MISEGDAAPDVVVEDSDGNSVKLLATVSGPFVLYFYPKDDTPGCTREALDFTDLADDFATIGVAVVGISKDPAKKHASFIKKHNLGVRLVTDADGSVCEAYGVWVEKSLYGRKYMGIERATFLVDADRKIAGIWRKVKVAGHAQQVLDAARTLK
ncbi:MAG: peroxiredoxin [Sphingomonadaceae bacterium]